MTSPEMLAAETVSGTVTHEPRDLDILCGKETKARNHKGSRCFRIFVDRYRKQYQEANNKHKRGEITKEMYLTITQANIRFLKFSEEHNGWVEISSTEARDKITHALRFAQKRSKRKTKRNVPARTGSDSTHRSESTAASGSTAASYDWDQLIMQQQSHLAGMSLGQMNDSLRGGRSSVCSAASVGSHASYVSQDSTSNHKRGSVASIGGTPKVSFAAGDPGALNPIYSASGNLINNPNETGPPPLDLSSSSLSFAAGADPTAGLAATYAAAQAKSSNENTTMEGVPLSVDLSSAQHFDMQGSQSSLKSDIIDMPPRMPARRTVVDDDDSSATSSSASSLGSDTRFDAVRDNRNSGGFGMLGPLLDNDRYDDDSVGSGVQFGKMEAAMGGLTLQQQMQQQPMVDPLSLQSRGGMGGMTMQQMQQQMAAAQNGQLGLQGGGGMDPLSMQQQMVGSNGQLGLQPGGAMNAMALQQQMVASNADLALQPGGNMNGLAMQQQMVGSNGQLGNMVGDRRLSLPHQMQQQMVPNVQLSSDRRLSLPHQMQQRQQQPMVAPNGELLQRQSSLQQHQQQPNGGLSLEPRPILESGMQGAGGSGRGAGTYNPTPNIGGTAYGAPQAQANAAARQQQQRNFNPLSVPNEQGDYSDLLMQEPLWEWEGKEM